MQDIKANSSKCPPEWRSRAGINKNKFTKHQFEWQEGYRAFSYSKSQSSRVTTYIDNQEIHHRKISFLDEYKNFLQKFEVDYDERYIFKPLSDE